MNNTESAQGIYASALAKIASLREVEALERVKALWPEVIEIGTRDDATEYSIVINPLVNILAAVLCGDYNAHFHSDGGTLQTLSVIGVCSAVTSRFRPGYALAKIEPDVSFKNTAKIGEAIIMSVKEIGARGPVSILELKGWVNEGQDALFTPRKLTMVKIPASSG